MSTNYAPVASTAPSSSSDSPPESPFGKFGQGPYSRQGFALAGRPVRNLLWALGVGAALLLISRHIPFPTSPELAAYRGLVLNLTGYHHALFDPYSRRLPDNSHLLTPEFVRDANGLLYPPTVAMNPYQRSNAAIVSLVRNNELDAMKSSMRYLEERFNRKFGYPWVFMNDVPFTEEFKQGVMGMTRSEVTFGLIPSEDWDVPDWVNSTYADETRQAMADKNIIYGDSLSYRKMCRFNSGFFFRQQVLEQFDYYWRVEPGVEFACDIDYDPFLFMQANNKTYGFTIALYEYGATIETLWATVQKFAAKFPEHIAANNAVNFLVDDKSKGIADGSYNLAHFWSNFEIGNLNFYRSKAYEDYFRWLDATGGFWYERWGDAPVHSIAVALLLDKSQIHQFDDIAYRHNPYTHCPTNPKLFESGKCNCKPSESFDNDGYSCMSKWWAVAGKPTGAH